MKLIVFHPEVAFRDCADCLIHQYHEEGKFAGRPVLRGERKQQRHHGCPPPCRTREGCHKGAAENPIELTDANYRCWVNYRECRAVGSFPDDPIVRATARIIGEIERVAEHKRELELATLSLRG